MTEFIFLIVGLLLGGCIGVTTMCCVQINRLNNNPPKRKEVDVFYEKDC